MINNIIDFLFLQFYIKKKYNQSVESYFNIGKMSVSGWRTSNEVPPKRRGGNKNINMKKLSEGDKLNKDEIVMICNYCGLILGVDYKLEDLNPLGVDDYDMPKIYYSLAEDDIKNRIKQVRRNKIIDELLNDR